MSLLLLSSLLSIDAMFGIAIIVIIIIIDTDCDWYNFIIAIFDKQNNN